MTKIILDIQREMTPEEVLKAQEILVALVSSGGLFGVRGGQTIIHFDAAADFQGIQLSYWPWRRRKKNEELRRT